MVVRATPDTIPAVQKRNTLRVEEAARQRVTASLERHYGSAFAAHERRVFFGFTASVALRSLPALHAATLIAEMLAEDPQLTLVIDRPLPVEQPIEHPRL